jgi:hypothetical protein
MSVRSWLVGTLCLLLPLAIGCDRANQSPDLRGGGTALDTPQASDREKRDLVLAGQLRMVEPKEEFLVVAFGDDLYEFAYSDATEIVGGTANAQGLTGNRGNQVTVHYRESPFTSTKTAVRIELQ